MNKEKDFFKTCFNTVASLEVENESQAIAKEVVLSEIENLQQENKQLKNNWNKLRECLKDVMNNSNDDDKAFVETILDIIHEIEQGSDSNENN